MKCKSIKILLSFLLCALLPVCPVSALEDENLLSTVSEPTKHYQVSEYGAIMQKLTDYKRSKTKVKQKVFPVLTLKMMNYWKL